MELLTQNLARLEQRDPALAQQVASAPFPPGCRLESARNGLPVLVVEGVRLLSGVDPQAEGRTLAAAAPTGPLAVFGLGLGYHLEPLAGRDLLVVQPEAGLIKLAFSARDFSELLGRIHLALSPEGLDDLAGRSLFLHRASAKAWPAAAAALERALAAANASRTRPPKPRVLLAPAVQGGSAPMAAWCAQSLAALGAETLLAPLEAGRELYRQIKQLPGEGGQKAQLHLTRSLGELTLAHARDFRPHLVLALAQAPLDAKTVASLRAQGAVTAMWFVEDFRQRAWFRELAPQYDHFFHIQGREMESELAALGVAGHFLPMAAHPPLHRPYSLSAREQEQYASKICFVGAAYPNRVGFFRSLLAARLPLSLFGPDWAGMPGLDQAARLPGQRLAPEQTAKAYSASPMVLNLHSGPSADFPLGGADFVNPRCFEAAACGSLLLSDQPAGLDRLLSPGSECLCYHSQTELIEIARHFMEHPGQASQIAARGRQKVLANHTYFHRMEALLAQTLGPAPAGQGPAPRGPAETTAGRLLDAMGRRE